MDYPNLWAYSRDPYQHPAFGRSADFDHIKRTTTRAASEPGVDRAGRRPADRGRNLILNGGICNLHCSDEFNGWLHSGLLVPLPTGFAHRGAAEAW